MPSILPGFEYDIFISYRHNDNRSGWVTEFVRHLQEELAATIKEPVSVYFDSNPHDGLLETHDVDDSLKTKLNCFIFIPIVSQTYCDLNSFAWKHEFQAFRKNAVNDHLGIKIKLANGNEGGRILPVCIHELDQDDKQLFEHELGSVLRGIEFIYKAPGVVRSLNHSEEEPKANLNHTYYRDQLNKVARTIKDLISAVQHPGSAQTISPPPTEINVPKVFSKKMAAIAMILVVFGVASFSAYYFFGVGQRLAPVPDTSIAILPFENLSNDPEQDYFSNGMTEDILDHLCKLLVVRWKE